MFNLAFSIALFPVVHHGTSILRNASTLKHVSFPVVIATNNAIV